MIPAGPARPAEPSPAPDGELRAHDVRDLWIVDGSVFPTSLGVNPQQTIMAFSLRAADRLADQLGG